MKAASANIAVTSRLVLRPWQTTPGDVAAALALFSDILLMKYIGPPMNTLEQARQALRRAKVHQQTYGYAMWAVVLKETNQIVGNCGLMAMDEPHLVEVGYHLLPFVWGRGLGSEALQATVDVAFSQLQLSTLVGLVLPENKASSKVLRKTGFQYVGLKSQDGENLQEYRLSHPAGKSAPVVP